MTPASLEVNNLQKKKKVDLGYLQCLFRKNEYVKNKQKKKEYHHFKGTFNVYMNCDPA